VRLRRGEGKRDRANTSENRKKGKNKSTLLSQENRTGRKRRTDMEGDEESNKETKKESKNRSTEGEELTAKER